MTQNMPDRMLRKIVAFANKTFGPGSPVKLTMTTVEDTPDGKLTTELSGEVVDGVFVKSEPDSNENQ